MNFIHLGFLAAGAAIAIPIAIHLLFRQKARVVPIGSIRFLQQVVREHQRRRRIREWLLLLLRTLAVAALALLFARPYFDAAARQALDQETVVLIDASASMQATDGAGGSSWTRAVEQARTTLASLDENVVAHVALFDSTGARELSLEQWENEAQPTAAATDYSLALAWARDVLAASNRSRQRVVLISDAQRSGIVETPPELLPKSVEFLMHDVGASLAPNVALTSVETLRTEIRPGQPIVVRATLRNFGPLPVRGLRVECNMEGPNGKVEASGAVDVPGRGTARVELPLTIQADGVYRGAASFEHADALTLDNRRWLAFEARRPDRVLLVDGQEGRSVFANETYYLETVLRLRPPEGSSQQRSFEAERIVWEAGEGFPRLDGYRAVVLANVRQFKTNDAQRLRAYVEGGGSVLVFVGDQCTRESLRPLADAGLSVGTIAETPREDRLRVTAWDEKHAAFKPLADPQRGDLRRLEFQRSLPIERPAEGTRALLSSGPTVLAAETQVGRGRYVYFGSSADRDWSDWPKTRLYVPLVRQLLAYLTDQLAERSLVEVREVERQGDALGIAEGESGMLTVRNLDPRESSLDRMEPDQWRESLGLAPWAPGELAQSAGLNITPPPNALRADEIWTTVVWILFVVLAAETLLASRVHA
ncbi:MAG: VWA domain-containing protein [Pirellulales bacterium]